jgi:hypothetical protein
MKSTHTHKSRINNNVMFRNMLATGFCISTAVVVFNPLDCLRIRWQCSTSNLTSMTRFARSIVNQEGLIRGLWAPGLGSNAIGAAVARGIGMGCYPTVRKFIIGNDKKNAFTMFLSGIISGGLGYGLSTPMWQIKTRLQASVNKPNPPFRNMFEALPKIFSEGGLRGLYRGAGPLVVRGALMNSGNTLGYDFAKTYNRENQVFNEGFTLHISASIFAAFLSTTFSIPADFVMTKYQTSSQYNSVLSLISDVFKNGGIRNFFRGWVPLFVRVAPVYIFYLPLYEQVRLLFGMGYFE